MGVDSGVAAVAAAAEAVVALSVAAVAAALVPDEDGCGFVRNDDDDGAA